MGQATPFEGAHGIFVVRFQYCAAAASSADLGAGDGWGLRPPSPASQPEAGPGFDQLWGRSCFVAQSGPQLVGCCSATPIVESGGAIPVCQGLSDLVQFSLFSEIPQSEFTLRLMSPVPRRREAPLHLSSSWLLLSFPVFIHSR